MTKLLEYVALYSFGFALMGAHTIGVPGALGVFCFWLGVIGLLLTTVLMAWREAPSRIARWRRSRSVAAAPLPEYVPLFEVALRGYEKSRTSLMARTAERMSEDGPIGWYARLLETEFPLYGRRPPSRIIERFDEIGFHLEVEGETVIARAPWSGGRWESISLQSADVPQAHIFLENRVNSFKLD